MGAILMEITCGNIDDEKGFVHILESHLGQEGGEYSISVGVFGYTESEVYQGLSIKVDMLFYIIFSLGISTYKLSLSTNIESNPYFPRYQLI